MWWLDGCELTLSWVKKQALHGFQPCFKVPVSSASRWLNTCPPISTWLLGLHKSDLCFHWSCLLLVPYPVWASWCFWSFRDLLCLLSILTMFLLCLQGLFVHVVSYMSAAFSWVLGRSPGLCTLYSYTFQSSSFWCFKFFFNCLGRAFGKDMVQNSQNQRRFLLEYSTAWDQILDLIFIPFYFVALKDVMSYFPTLICWIFFFFLTLLSTEYTLLLDFLIQLERHCLVMPAFAQILGWIVFFHLLPSLCSSSNILWFLRTCHRLLLFCLG